MHRIARIYLLSVALLLLTTTLWATTPTTHSSTIEIQRGEKWWGIFTSNAPLEPFLAPFKVNTADSPVSGFYMPIMLSSNGRYIWSSAPMEVEFDGIRIKIDSQKEKVMAQRGGKTLRDAYLSACHKHFKPSGVLPDTSMFSLPQYDTSVELGYLQSQVEVLEYAERILENGLPAGVLVIGDGWHSQNSPYEFDLELYPSVDEMLERLHSMGFKVMLTLTPYNSACGRRYAEGVSKGYFLRDSLGEPLVISTSGGFSVSYDLSDPTQKQIVEGEIARLRERYSIDGFRFDSSSITPQLLESGELYTDFIAEWVSLGDGLRLCEYISGSSTPLYSYVNTLNSDYEISRDRLVATINDLISIGLIGFPYSQIASSITDTTALFSDQVLMAKYLQLQSVMPVMKISFAPWRITDDALYRSVREALALRTELSPYINELVSTSVQSGEPLIRHMEYQFARSGFSDCNDQFMLGSKLLFVPNATDQSRVTVRLPRGTWLSRDGKRYKGPLVMEVDGSSSRMLLFELSR